MRSGGLAVPPGSSSASRLRQLGPRAVLSKSLIVICHLSKDQFALILKEVVVIRVNSCYTSCMKLPARLCDERVMVYLTAPDIAALDAWGREMGLTRSATLRALVRQAGRSGAPGPTAQDNA